MKKILFISTNIQTPWGGSEELWSKTAERLAKGKMFDVGILVKKWNPVPKQIKLIKECGGKLFYVDNVLKNGIGRLLSSLSSNFYDRTRHLQYEVKQTLRTFKPDFIIISAGFEFQADWAIKACIAEKTPYINIIQLVTYSSWPDDKVMDAYRGYYEKAVHNFFVSKNNLTLLANKLAIPLSNASVTRNPYKVKGDLIPFPSVQNGYHLGCPANLYPAHKGQNVLIEIFAQQKWKERNISLNLYGKGSNEKTLKKLKELLGTKKVHFYGHVNDIEAIWAKNHALILASRHEGLPLVLVEAMLCGRTAIVTNVGGTAEILNNMVTGFIAKASTSECLDESMELAWERKEEWEQMGEMASKSLTSILSTDPVGGFIEEIIQKFKIE